MSVDDGAPRQLPPRPLPAMYVNPAFSPPRRATLYANPNATAARPARVIHIDMLSSAESSTEPHEAALPGTYASVDSSNNANNNHHDCHVPDTRWARGAGPNYTSLDGTQTQYAAAQKPAPHCTLAGKAKRVLPQSTSPSVSGAGMPAQYAVPLEDGGDQLYAYVTQCQQNTYEVPVAGDARAAVSTEDGYLQPGSQAPVYAAFAQRAALNGRRPTLFTPHLGGAGGHKEDSAAGEMKAQGAARPAYWRRGLPLVLILILIAGGVAGAIVGSQSSSGSDSKGNTDVQAAQDSTAATVSVARPGCRVRRGVIVSPCASRLTALLFSF